tara:strand:+ start:230 stop:406 length:177 start_codon:yes stop_codon:yes gene_type:complete
MKNQNRINEIELDIQELQDALRSGRYNGKLICNSTARTNSVASKLETLKGKLVRLKNK